MANVSKRSYSIDLVRPDDITDELLFVTMKAVTKIVAKRAKAIAPRGTGKRQLTKKGKPRKRLYQTIRARVLQRGKVAAVAATAFHAHLVHEGTKAHFIPVRKGGKALVIGGHIIGGKGVMHPGQKGQPFLTDAAEQSRGAVAAAIKGIADGISTP